MHATIGCVVRKVFADDTVLGGEREAACSGNLYFALEIRACRPKGGDLVYLTAASLFRPLLQVLGRAVGVMSVQPHACGTRKLPCRSCCLECHQLTEQPPPLPPGAHFETDAWSVVK